MFLVRVQTMVKNRIHALLSQHPVGYPDVSDLFGKAGRQWLREVPLPSSDRRVLDSDLTLLEILQQRITATNGLLKELSAGDEAVRWLASLPGIGDFYSVLIRYESMISPGSEQPNALLVIRDWCLPPMPAGNASSTDGSPSVETSGCAGHSSKPLRPQSGVRHSSAGTTNG
jgi:hypothetical protein